MSDFENAIEFLCSAAGLLTPKYIEKAEEIVTITEDLLTLKERELLKDWEPESKFVS